MQKRRFTAKSDPSNLLKVEGNITKLVSADRKSSSQQVKAGGKSIQQLVKDCVICFTDCVTSC